MNVTSIEQRMNEEKRRAGEAASLVNNKLLQNAFSELEAQYMALAQGADLNDDVTRRNAVAASVVVKHVRQHLNMMVQTGALADHELGKLKGRKRRSLF